MLPRRLTDGKSASPAIGGTEKAKVFLNFKGFLKEEIDRSIRDIGNTLVA